MTVPPPRMGKRPGPIQKGLAALKTGQFLAFKAEEGPDKRRLQQVLSGRAREWSKRNGGEFCTRAFDGEVRIYRKA